MELGCNQKPIQQHTGTENPNPLEPPNINIEIDEGLTYLRSIVCDLRGTREPSRLSLVTSVDAIVLSITIS
jgi:hypothetical protein